AAWPCRIAYIAGRTPSVATVASSRPPITARPRGADCAPPSPAPIAIGSMPKIIAEAVIRTARKRAPAPSLVASQVLRPSRRPGVRDRLLNPDGRFAKRDVV